MQRARIEAAQRQIDRDFPLAVLPWRFALAVSVAYAEQGDMMRIRSAE